MIEITTTGETFPKQKSLTNGDAITTATLVEAWTTSAERAQFLREILRQGVERARVIPSSADLASVQANDGDLRVIMEPYPALWVFVGTPTPAAPGMVVPYDNPSEGSWVNVLWMLGTLDGDVVKFDSNVIAVPNRILEVISTVKTSDTTILDNSTWQVVHSLNRDMQVGDKMQLRALGRLTTSDAATGLELGWRLRVTAPGPTSNTPIGSDLGQLAPWANKKFQFSTEGIWTASVAGLHTFALEVQAPSYGGGSYGVVAVAPTSLRGLWLRP